MNERPRSFGAVYREAERAAGGCPIEAGLLLRLADNECAHGRLPGDRTEPCGCWSRGVAGVPMLTLIKALAPTGQGRTPEQAQRILARRARTVELYEAGMPVRAIAAMLGTTQPTVVSDLHRLRKAGLVGNRREERVAA